MRIKKSDLAVAFMATAVLAMAHAARADVTVTTKTTIDSPLLTQARAKMGSEQLAMMDNMMSTTSYYSGKRYRIDTGFMSSIVDGVTKQMIMINPTQHTYSTVPIDRQMMSRILGKSGMGLPSAAGGSMPMKVTDTGKSTQFMGHKCRHYIINMTMTIPQAGKMTMRADILAAQDISGVDPDVQAYMAQQSGIPSTGIKGLPLLTVSTVSGSTIGDMKVKVAATNVSMEPISANTFDVPQGYEQVDISTFMPSNPAAVQASPAQQ